MKDFENNEKLGGKMEMGLKKREENKKRLEKMHATQPASQLRKKSFVSFANEPPTRHSTLQLKANIQLQGNP